MKLDEMMTLLGMTLEEAQRLISENFPEQQGFITGKYRAKARVTHPDKDGTSDLMTLLNLSKEWLSTAANLREALVTFINTENPAESARSGRRLRRSRRQRHRPAWKSTRGKWPA